MFTSLQSIQIAQEIQADHRRRARALAHRALPPGTPELPVTRPLVLVRDPT